MVKDLYYSLQIALLILAGCGAFDSWYRGELAGVTAAVIIIACVMAIYSATVFYLRTTKGKETEE